MRNKMKTTSTRIIAYSLDIVATLILAIAILLVHKRIIKDGSIDAKVVKSMKIEAVFVYVAVIFFLTSFILLLFDETR